MAVSHRAHFVWGCLKKPFFETDSCPIAFCLLPKEMLMERVRIKLEFIFRASPTILYQFLTTPACLVRWFCDEVDINGHIYSFIWGGMNEDAELIEDIEDELVRFRWAEADFPNEFLEFHIYESPVTGETILELTDFCDANEVKDQKHYWDTQIQLLQKETGGFA